MIDRWFHSKCEGQMISRIKYSQWSTIHTPDKKCSDPAQFQQNSMMFDSRSNVAGCYLVFGLFLVFIFRWASEDQSCFAYKKWTLQFFERNCFFSSSNGVSVKNCSNLRCHQVGCKSHCGWMSLLIALNCVFVLLVIKPCVFCSKHYRPGSQ